MQKTARQNNITKNIIPKSNGFTLVEIMVATSIFMMIMLVALGALITSSDAAKKAQSMRSAMDNVNFAMESIVRSLRSGTDYTCVNSSSFTLPASATADCPIGSLGGIAVIFKPAKHLDADTAYVLKDRANGTKVLQRCFYSSINVTTSCLDIVSPDVDINQLSFFVNGSDLADKVQPSVYILIKGSVIFKGESNTFAIQTNVSQRSAE